MNIKTLSALIDKSNIEKSVLKEYVKSFTDNYNISAEVFTLAICGHYKLRNTTQEKLEHYTNTEDLNTREIFYCVEMYIKNYLNLNIEDYIVKIDNFDFLRQNVYGNIINKQDENDKKYFSIDLIDYL